MWGDGQRSSQLSRRQLLQRGAGLAGALAAAPLFRPLGAASRAAAGPSTDASSGRTDDARTAGGAPGAPTAPTVDGLAAPIGISPEDVNFAWHVGDARRGARQAAYRIVVTRLDPTVPDGNGATVVWDSGRRRKGRQAFVPYGGPSLAPDSVYGWTVRTWAPAGGPGPPSTTAVFETGLRDADWAAQWITRKADPRVEPVQYTYARQVFTLAASPIVRARLYVSADQRYQCSVNGTRAGTGQAYSYPDTQYYETLDITALLLPGAANALAILTNWQGPAKGHPAGSPGLIAQLSVLHRSGERALVVTDGSWRVRRGPWLPGTQRDLEGDVVDYTENVSGPDTPLGWDAPGFDDSTWDAATVLGPPGTAPWTRLVSVRTRLAESPVAAVSTTLLPSGAVVADFGKVYAAVPTVAFTRGTQGKVVTMRAGYLLDQPSSGRPVDGEPGQVSRTHGTQHTDMSYSYVQRGGREQFRPFDYLGFRYFQVDDPGEPLSAGDLVALARHCAVPDEHAATFTSSQPTIDAVFELGRHSALYCAQEQFVDTPTREKGPWLWDGFNESQTAMAAFGEQNLTHRALLEFAQSQRRYWPNGAVNKIYPTGLGPLDIDESTEIYPEWVWRYWMNTGDEALLGAVYPAVAGVARYVARAVSRSTGLVTNLPSTSGTYTLPVVTRLNILGINVFRRAAQVAAALGRPRREVASQLERQTALTDAVNASLTRDDGVYVDGLDAAGNRVRSTSQEANACALAYDVVPADRRGAVAAHVAAPGLVAPPRTATEVLVALALHGHLGDVVRILTDSAHDGWAAILARGGTFTWEVWRPSDAAGDSMSHGWGSNVLVAIQRLLLGVRPSAPGFAAVEIAPAIDSLSWAEGTVPTPRGPVEVSWHRPAGASGAVELDVTVPPNAGAVVRFPVGAMSLVTESGRPIGHGPGVQLLSLAAGEMVVAIGAGDYHFRRSGRAGA